MKFESFEPEMVERFWDKIEVLVRKVKEKKKTAVHLKFERTAGWRTSGPTWRYARSRIYVRI